MDWRDIALSVIVALISSSGIWAFVTTMKEKNSKSTRLLMGLAHNHIIEFGIRAIERGWIFRDEYDDLMTYSFEPYEQLGGNGMCMRVIREVEKLPIKYRSIPKGGSVENHS